MQAPLTTTAITSARRCDPWGNLLQKNLTQGTAETFSATANAQNRLVGYAYDAAGNMTTGGYSYDAENRIAAIGNINYVYDGDGARVKKSSGKLYWGAGPLAETDLSGNIANEYIFFGGKRIARRDATGALHYYFADHLGSSNVITTAGGVIEEESDFFPFGGEINVLANGSNRYKFTGKERDAETGLDYFGARYYGGTMGRWMSPDWSARPTPVPYADFSNPQSLNLYGYVGNNPMARADADGHQQAIVVDGPLPILMPRPYTQEETNYIANGIKDEVGRFTTGATTLVHQGIDLAGNLIAAGRENLQTTTPASTPPPAAGQVPAKAPDFVGDAGGNVVAIPPGSVPRHADNSNGTVYQPPLAPGQHEDAGAIRVMGPTPAQPTGSITVHGPTGARHFLRSSCPD